MKLFQIFVCVFVVSLLLCSDAMAQRGGMRGMMRMRQGSQIDSALLAMKEVQEELEFTDEQKEDIGKKASDLNDDFRGELRSLMRDGGDPEEMEEIVKEFREEEKEFVELLKDDQKNRLSQLRFQRMGNNMYEDEKVQEELGIDDEQKTSITDAIKASSEKLQEAIEEARDSGDFGGIREAMAANTKELDETLSAVLTEEQKTKVAELKGGEFEFPQRERRRRGGRSDF